MAANLALAMLNGTAFLPGRMTATTRPSRKPPPAQLDYHVASAPTLKASTPIELVRSSAIKGRMRSIQISVFITGNTGYHEPTHAVKDFVDTFNNSGLFWRFITALPVPALK
ncbi:hypothetical protein [Psychrobacter immobilis]|uniref:hypothetical protein n=1 Tax=Psychrobacter immobilis TaxID=498 RepID=UPI001918FFE3|nr:hypothetical protein [Psychrobacter immobilis]